MWSIQFDSVKYIHIEVPPLAPPGNRLCLCSQGTLTPQFSCLQATPAIILLLYNFVILGTFPR